MSGLTGILAALCVFCAALAAALFFVQKRLEAVKKELFDAEEKNRALKSRLAIEEKKNEVIRRNRNEADGRIRALHGGDSVSNAIDLLQELAGE